MKDIFNQIEDYLSGNLSPEENRAFAARIEQEPDLSRLAGAIGPAS